MTHRVSAKQQEVQDILPEREGGALSEMQVYPHDVALAEQNKNEEIFILLRRHIFTNVGWIIIATFLGLLPVALIILISVVPEDLLQDFPIFEGFNTMQVLFGVLLWYSIVFTYAYMKFVDWFYNIYLITNERIIDYDFFPMISYKISEARLENIEDATQDSIGFFPALFHYGDVFIQTAAEKREFDFKSVPNPAWVRDKLMDLVDLKLSK